LPIRGLAQDLGFLNIINISITNWDCILDKTQRTILANGAVG
jgi:hypothetical protein